MKPANPLPELSTDKLRWTCPTSYLPFETTDDLQPFTGVIGQDRAIRSLELGLRVDADGYNIFVTGLTGSDRLSRIEELLERTKDGSNEPPPDICCVNNFKDPDQPRVIYLDAGKGRELQTDVRELIESLKTNIPEIFESEEYKNRRKEITENFRNRQREVISEFERKVDTENFKIVQIQAGPFTRPAILPIVMGNPMPLEQVKSLVDRGEYPRETYERLEKKQEQLSAEMETIFSELQKREKDFEEKMKDLDRELVGPLLAMTIEGIKQKYNHPKISEYLDQMREHLLENFREFLPQQQQPQMPFGMPPGKREPTFTEYQVNLLVDNSETKGRPVVIEKNPNYRNVFGGIERMLDPRLGVWRADFSGIKSGALLKANGGYLILNFLDAVLEPGVWQTLMRVLKNRSVEIQSFDPFYFFSTSALKPESIELRTKAIILGDNRFYYLMHNMDEDFKNIFKVKADFDTQLNNEEQIIQQYAAYIKKVCDDKKLRPADRSGVSAIVEHGVRIAGRKKKISAKLHRVDDIMTEADYWAAQDHAAVITGDHVRKAIEGREYRVNLIEDKIQELIEDNILMIDTEGAVVGQVNGLSIFDLGDHSFGRPSRITARTAMGRAGVINIEREVALSGKIHDKGVLILSGYLLSRYAQTKPLTMNASVTFEQSYSGVEGDSASSTELYAILSSLADLPLRQDIAVTGSVNQKGEIQPIGGVNEKIEGFYDVCRARGLTGTQGVIIPHQNVDDLMLRQDVLGAVGEGKFHVYSVKTVDQGIELLSGVQAGDPVEDGTYPEGTVNFLVDKKLRDLAEGIKAFVSEEKGGKEAAPPETKGCGA